MQLYSQKDKSYGKRLIPKSNLTMAGYGCFITSIAMLAQKHPTELLQDEFFVSGGYIYSERAANSVGLSYNGATRMPPKKGWCIGVTRHYSPKYPTHFFLVNVEKGLQIDPLDTNPKIEPLTYNCFQYRLFGGIKLGEDNKTEEAIKLNSEAWHLLGQAQSNLNKANDLLRSQS